jgi:NAD(P)H-hydrate epimerase
MIIPAITTDQMREIDRIMVEIYGIELIQMMENAGRNLASLARKLFLNGEVVDKQVWVFAGSGGNGGGGLVAARHLYNWGINIQVYTTKSPSEFKGVPRHQLSILQVMGVPIFLGADGLDVLKPDLIVDAIIGYSLDGAPLGQAAALINAANKSTAPILSLDIPSGIDATSGRGYDPHINAAATLTLALPKTGLLEGSNISSVGELYLADISVPPQLYRHFGFEVPSLFQKNAIIHID